MAQSLMAGLKPLQDAVSQMKVRQIQITPDEIVLRMFRKADTMGNPRHVWDWGVASRLIVEKGGFEYFLATGFGVQLREDGIVRFGCGHVVGFTVKYEDHLSETWVLGSDPVQVGSAAAEEERNAIVQNGLDTFPAALEHFEKMIGTG
jgi:hypothetical protein